MKKVVGFLLMCLLVVWVDAQTVTFNKAYEDDDGNLPLSVLETEEGYISIGSGWSDIFGGWTALKIIKTDFNGNHLWTKYYGSEYWACYPGYNGSLHLTPDSNYLFSGYKVDTFDNFNFWIVKFDDNGDTLWSRTIDLGAEEIYFNTQILSNGDIACVGSTSVMSHVQEQLYIACYDQNGNFKWEKLYGNSGYDAGYYIEKTSDHGFIISGVTESRGWDGWLIKTDSLANIQWQRSFGTTGDEVPLGVVENPEGGYFVWGNYDSLAPGAPVVGLAFLYKLDSLGSIIWGQYYPPSYNSKSINRVRIYDGHLYFCGITDDNQENDFQGWFVKMTLDGNVLWERHIFNSASPINVRGDWFEDFQKTRDGGFILTGPSSNINRNPNSPILNRNDFWLVKIDSNGCLYPTTACVTGLEEVRANSLVSVSPNPNFGQVTFSLPSVLSTVKLKMFSLTGQEVLSDVLFGGDNLIDIGSLSPGIYLYQITFNEHIQTGKLILE